MCVSLWFVVHIIINFPIVLSFSVLHVSTWKYGPCKMKSILVYFFLKEIINFQVNKMKQVILGFWIKPLSYEEN